MNKTLKEIVESLAASNYECEAGPLKNNEDFRKLAEFAGVNVDENGSFSEWVTACSKDASDALFRAFGKPKSTTSGGLCGEVRKITRDEILEKAKRDVAELVNANYAIDITTQPTTFTPISEDIYWESIDDFEFVINREKRTVVALIHFAGKVERRGIAKCDPSDCFNVHIGKAIALRRSLGLEVPTEYLNAPQPTEVRVGDIVGYPYDTDDDSRDVITSVENRKAYYGGGFHEFSELFGNDVDGPLFDPRIIDDSRE